MKDLISDNTNSADKKNGLLTANKQSYLDCLSLREEEFERLLQQDAKHWNDCLRRARQGQKTHENAIKEFLER